MNSEYVREAIHKKLFANTELTDLLGNEMHYARVPVNQTLPQLIYFEVSEVLAYKIDFSTVTFQFSIWSSDKFEVQKIKGIVSKMFHRLSEVVTTHLGDCDINYTELVDSSALPDAEVNVFGQQLRFRFMYRGENIT